MKKDQIKKQNKVIDYIGSKEKLFDFIEEKINVKTNSKILDIFAGSNVFNKLMYEKHLSNNIEISINDYQYFSLISSFYTDGYMEKERLISLITDLDNQQKIEGDIFNEFCENGNPKSILNKKNVFNHIIQKTGELEPQYRMFFSESVGKKADGVKKRIKELYKSNKINEEEKNILLLFLLNYLDKNANTTSVYGAYLKENKIKKEIPFFNELMIEWLSNKNKINNKIKERFNMSVLDLLDKLKNENKKYDIIYMDPPYGTRDYFTLYHILNYIVDLNFNPLKDIRIDSKTAIPNKTLKNIFSNSTTFDTFKKMILDGIEVSDKIFISYNNESFLKIEQFEEIFKEKNLNYKLHKKEHQRYISRTDRESHTKIEEWLFEIYR